MLWDRFSDGTAHGHTSIEWTKATWNPVAGCTVISPGCTNCYARCGWQPGSMRWARRNIAGWTRKSGKRAVWTGKVRLDHNALDIPAGWKKPRRIFVNSMSGPASSVLVSATFVAAVWDAMQATPQHTYHPLTKRPDQMAKITASLPVLPNAGLGTSVESADYLGRIDDLRKVDAAVRFVSVRAAAWVGGSGRSAGHSAGDRRRRERPAFAADGATSGSRRLRPHAVRQGRPFSSNSGAERTRRPLGAH